MNPAPESGNALISEAAQRLLPDRVAGPKQTTSGYLAQSLKEPLLKPQLVTVSREAAATRHRRYRKVSTLSLRQHRQVPPLNAALRQRHAKLRRHVAV